MLGYNRFAEADDADERGGRLAFRVSRLALSTELAPVNDRTTRGLAAEIHALPEARRQLIFRLRREIAEGTYDTDEKMEVALDRMLDRLSLDDRG